MATRPHVPFGAGAFPCSHGKPPAFRLVFRLNCCCSNNLSQKRRNRNRQNSREQIRPEQGNNRRQKSHSRVEEGRGGLRLGQSRRFPSLLQIDGRLCHLVLAFLVVGDFTNSRAPSLHGRYPASTLLRTHPSPSRLRSTSRLSRLYDRPCSGDFAPGRGGLLQLLGMSLSPCC